MLLPAGSASAERARTSESALLVRGPGGRSAPHAHHWWHLVVSLEEPLRARGPSGEWMSAPAVLTPPDVVHAIESVGEVAILYLERESRIAGSFAAAHPHATLRGLSDREAAPIRSSLGADAAPDEVIAVLAQVLGASAAPLAPRHPAIARVLRHLDDAPPDADVSAVALARVAGLSRSRFMHAFAEQVGLPLRPYVRWLRVRRAAAAMAAGALAGEAAHAAGFSDAAHFTRTFRAMFGVTPSEMMHRAPDGTDARAAERAR